MCLSKSLSRSTRACLHWLCTIISSHHGYSPVHTSPYQSDLLPAKLFLAETCLSLSHVQAADMSICMISLSLSLSLSLCVCVCVYKLMCVNVKACDLGVDEGTQSHGCSWITVKSTSSTLPLITASHFQVISSTKIGDDRNLSWSQYNFIDPFQPPSI